MNDVTNRWWFGLVALILILALGLAASQTEFAQGAAGLLVLLLLGVGLIALLVVVAALWPGFTRRTRTHLESSPGKSLMVGLVNYLFLGAIALVLLNLGPLGAFGLALAGVLLVGTLLGLPAAAGLVGERLHHLREREANHWDEIVAGGAALYLAVWVPFAGWFVALPALCLWSFGAAALSLVSRQRPKAADVE